MVALRPFLKEYMTAGMQNEESAKVITEVLEQTGDFGLLTLVSDARKLYDFFDRYGLAVSVSPKDVTGSTGFDAIIVRPGKFNIDRVEVETIDSDLSPRANSELSAFMSAFSILESIL